MFVSEDTVIASAAAAPFTEYEKKIPFQFILFFKKTRPCAQRTVNSEQNSNHIRVEVFFQNIIYKNVNNESVLNYFLIQEDGPGL